MGLNLVDPPSQACVWMQAGILRYWLCNRNFDCEHCPLDAALRGGCSAPPPLPKKRTPSHRPATRRVS